MNEEIGSQVVRSNAVDSILQLILRDFPTGQRVRGPSAADTSSASFGHLLLQAVGVVWSTRPNDENKLYVILDRISLLISK